MQIYKIIIISITLVIASYGKLEITFQDENKTIKEYQIPNELRLYLNQNNTNKKPPLHTVPLFSETCDNIQYNGAVEDMTIEYLKNTKEMILDFKKPFTSMSSFEKNIFKFTFAYCLKKILPKRLNESKNEVFYALGNSPDDTMVGVGIHSNPGEQALGVTGEFTLKPIKTMLKASGDGVSVAFNGFINEVQTCVITNREKFIKEFYALISFNANLKINYLSSVTNMCKFELHKKNEVPSWNNLYPSINTLETDINSYVNSKDIGGEFHFSFNEKISKNSKCILGVNSLTAKKCATLREIELSKLRKKVVKSANIKMAKISDVENEIVRNVNDGNNTVTIKFSYDNLFSNYFGLINSIFSNNLSSAGRTEKRRDVLKEIFYDTYKPYILISHKSYGAKAYEKQRYKKVNNSIFEKFIIDTFKFNIGQNRYKHKFNELAYYKEAVIATKEFIKDNNIKNGNINISIKYANNNNFNYKKSLTQNCRSWHNAALNNNYDVEYKKSIDINDITKIRAELNKNCHPFYTNIFTKIETVLRPQLSYAERIKNINRVISASGKIKDLTSQKLNEQLLKDKLLKEKMENM